MMVQPCCVCLQVMGQGVRGRPRPLTLMLQGPEARQTGPQHPHPPRDGHGAEWCRVRARHRLHQAPARVPPPPH